MIPKVLWSGFTDPGDVFVMVLEQLGSSLSKLRKNNNNVLNNNLNKTVHGDNFNRLSMKGVLMVSIQMIHCVELLHRRGYLHSDIKPANFIFGKDKNEVSSETITKLYVDFMITHNCNCRKSFTSLISVLRESIDVMGHI